MATRPGLDDTVTLRIEAPSRLHFGLLSLPTETTWPNHAGERLLRARRFGGAGLMVDEPGIRLSARPAPAWTAEGPLAGRVLAFARAAAEGLPAGTAVPHAFRLHQAAPEHQGLGTGTQLGLAVASAVAAAAGQSGLAVSELARCVGRGQRSGLGIHGFARGGLLVEGGKAVLDGVAPLVARLDFPEDWPLVIVLPPGTGLHGRAERQAFEQLAQTSAGLEATDRLCRLVLLGLLPAAAEHDWRAFGEALFDFNVRVGEMFAPVQGGVYAHPVVAAVVAWVCGQGIAGVGQSSWGPAVYAVAGDADAAADLAVRLRRRFGWGAEAVFITKARNQGATSEIRHGSPFTENDS